MGNNKSVLHLGELKYVAKYMGLSRLSILLVKNKKKHNITLTFYV